MAAPGFNIGPARFYGNDVLAMCAIPFVIAGLAWFLNKTDIGVAVRACAESSDRASLLGRRVGLRRTTELAFVMQPAMLAKVLVGLVAAVFRGQLVL